MKKIAGFSFVVIIFVSFASCGNSGDVKKDIPLEKKGITSPEAEKVPGFKYLLDKYDYGMEGKYEAGYYNPFEKIPNIREYKGYYILDLFPDSRNFELLGYVVELTDARRRVLDFRFYPGKPEYLAVKKIPGSYKFILYSVKLNGNYFERGVYLSQSYWEHVVISEAIKKGSYDHKQYTQAEIEASDLESCIPIVRADELVQNKQKYIWKMVALRWAETVPQFIKVDIHDSGVFTDDGLAPEILQKRYSFYSPGWFKPWSKDATVYGVLCEVPEEWFEKLFKDKKYLESPKKPEEKKDIKDIKLDHYFQVIF